ncbi:MAG: cytochrome c5 family protein [Bordetella sp.]|nr:MAG: cytochrome c5 family protein [Bordetella sp.]
MVVFLAFVIPIAIISMIVNIVVSGNKAAAGSDSLSEEAINMRIAPIAKLEFVDINAPRVFKTGEQVFSSVCAACHLTGIAGAPKIGDHSAWAGIIQAGYEAALKIAIYGKDAMPPKGGNPNLSDYEVARAMVYIANQSGGAFSEPEIPNNQS